MTANLPAFNTPLAEPPTKSADFMNEAETFREIYRWRAGIEATMSRLKYQMNLAHLRIRGMPAMRYVVHLRALSLNICRCAAIGP